MFPQLYELAWAYPFEKVVLFRDLTLERNIDVHQPVCVIAEKEMLDLGVYYWEELSENCSRLLFFQEEYGSVSDVAISKYHQLYAKVIRELHLEALYGKVDDKGN